MSAKFKPMAHQAESIKFMARRKRAFDASDPGTGKTLVQIEDFVRQHKKDKKAMLVLCPKSLMQAAWGNDIAKFAPHLRVSQCLAKDRMKHLEADADVYVVNIDGVKDLARLPKKFWKKFGRLVIDESEGYKHRTSQRAKAAKKVAEHFDTIRLMSGTPATNGICDLWHQYYILDDGERLGKEFYGFRSACCVPVPNGSGFNEWVDREGIEVVVAELVKDITIRHKFEDCVDIPDNHVYSIQTELSKKHRKTYEELLKKSIATLEKTTVTAINGAALYTKLMQSASGAVYDDDGGHTVIDTDRYELVLDLVEARRHSVVFYLWEHQRVELEKLAKKRKLAHATWDSGKPELADQFQAGELRVLFAHPASAAHGLTLTAASATIWASPTYNLSWFVQGSGRITRIGQKQKTENIVVIAKDTVDETVYDKLLGKEVSLTELLEELA